MTLNGVIDFILFYFTEFDSFAAYYVISYRLPLLAKANPLCSAVSSAIAELLVHFIMNIIIIFIRIIVQQDSKIYSK